SYGPLQCREQRLGVAIRNGHYWNFGECNGFAEREPLGVLGGAHTRSERVARIDGHVHYAAALRAIFRTIRAFWKCLAGEVAVFVGIGINQTPDGAMFRGDLGFDAAPGSAI